MIPLFNGIKEIFKAYFLYRQYPIFHTVTMEIMVTKDGKCTFKDVPKGLDESFIKGMFLRCGKGWTAEGNRLPSEEIIQGAHLYLFENNRDALCGHPLSHFIHDAKSGHVPGSYGNLYLPNGFNPTKSYITFCCKTVNDAGEVVDLEIPADTYVELVFIVCEAEALCVPQ